jgi:hypothetical protein
MKFNLFLLTIVLLGSIPCFCKKLETGLPVSDCDDTCQAQKYFKAFQCRSDGISHIRDNANRIYQEHVDTPNFKAVDEGTYFEIGRVSGCEGTPSADTCSCLKKKVNFFEEPIRLKETDKVKTHNTMTQIHQKSTQSQVILIQKKASDEGFTCNVAIADKVVGKGLRHYYIKEMTCPPKVTIWVTTHKQRGDEFTHKKSRLSFTTKRILGPIDPKGPFRRRRLLHQGGCDT